MILKMLGFGFFFEHNAFFRNKWNCFDFALNLFIISLHSVMRSTGMRISLFESIRFLKLLKIPPIQIILVKIGSTLLLLAETFTIVLWFVIFYAIWGLQLYSGLLKNSCIDSSTGFQYLNCGNTAYQCPANQFCARMLSNPDYGVSNYDNLLSAALQVFKIISTDDWTSSMFLVQKTFTKMVWIYYVSLVVFGNFFMMNMILAVLKVKYGQNDISWFKELRAEKVKVYDLKELRDKRIIISRNREGMRRKIETILPKIITDSKILQVETRSKALKEISRQKTVA